MNHTYTIETSFGHALGKMEEGIACFRGVRFGVGKRWQRAEMIDYENTDIDGTGISIDPIQVRGNHENQSENELFLNIYLNPEYEGKRAVMAYTPVGGGVISAGTSIHPHRFLQEHPECMVVVCNNRVGVLSSLNLSLFEDRDDYGEEYKASCNITKTDFILALQWIRKYIEEFGGDKNNVTISGHSYGSTVTNTMLMAPEAEGLFHKAICRSAYAIDSNMLMGWEESLQIARAFMKTTGVKTIREALEIPAEEMLKIQGEMMQYLKPGIPDGDFPGTLCPPFCTVIDNEVIFENYFDQLVKTAKSVPLMTGCTDGDNDGRFNENVSPEEALEDITVRYYDKLDPEKGGILREEILETYLRTHDGDAKSAYRDLNADLGMRKNTLELCWIFSKVGKAYQYYYACVLEGSGKRAWHGAAEAAAWGNPCITPDVMARCIRDTYASFMMYGDPNVNNPSFEASKEEKNAVLYPKKLEWKPFTYDQPYAFVYENSGCGLSEGIRTEDGKMILKTVAEYDRIMEL